MSKVVSIGTANPGMSQLFEMSAKNKSKTIEPTKPPEDKCLLVHIPLQYKSYFVSIEDGLNIAPATISTQQGQQILPVIFITLSKAYSEISVANKNVDAEGKEIHKIDVIGVQRHENLSITNTGIVYETVDTPRWWDKRDDGGF